MISAISFAQILNKTHELAKGRKSNDNYSYLKVKTPPFWSEDFANGIPPTWINSTAPWVYRGPSTTPGVTVGSQGAYASSGTPIASATRTNGFIIFDSDYYDNGGVQGNFGQGMYPTPHNGELMTDMIDLSLYSDVTLMAHSYFRTFQGQAFVAFYVNGIYDSQVQVHSTLAVNDGTATNAVALIRFPSNACGNANVQMKFLFDGTTQSNVNGSGYYFWMLDDLELIETPTYLMDVIDQNHGGWDIGYSSTIGFGMDYTFKTLIQSNANPYMFEMTLANVGANPLHGIQMNIEVLDDIGTVVFTSNSDTTTLAVLDTSSYMATNTFAPTNMGIYDMRFWANSDDLPSSSTSDTSYMQTIITDSVYGRDYGNPQGAWRVGRQCGGLQLANYFDVYAQDEITSVSAHVADYSKAGATMFGVLYEVDTTSSPTTFIWMDQTDDYIIQQTDIDNWVTIMFNQPYDAIPGSYMIAIGGYAHPTDTFGISVSGQAEVTMSRIQDNGCNLGSQPWGYWYWITDLPMIRMNFGIPSTQSNIEEESFDGSLNIYPNPTNGVFTIEMDNVKNDVYSFEISNVLGQKVFSNTKSIKEFYKEDFDLTALNKGIYLIEIKNSSSSITERIIVE